MIHQYNLKHFQVINIIFLATASFCSIGPTSNKNTGENIFGPTYDSPSKQNTNNKMDPLHLNVGIDRQHPYRPLDARRDEAVNTVDTTFRRLEKLFDFIRIFFF
jgi:hypothetical protein